MKFFPGFAIIVLGVGCSEHSKTIAFISMEQMKADTMALASDEMKGREAGIADFYFVSLCVADRFAEMNIWPPNDNGSYFQTISLQRFQRIWSEASISLQSRTDNIEWIPLQDFLIITGFIKSGDATYKAFIDKHYHKPSDSTVLSIQYIQGARFAAMNYDLVQAIADAPHAPYWL